MADIRSRRATEEGTGSVSEKTVKLSAHESSVDEKRKKEISTFDQVADDLLNVVNSEFDKTIRRLRKSK